MKREPKTKAEAGGRNYPVFRLLSLVLASFVLLGCSRGKVERLEWTVMDTVAAVQIRGGSADCDVVEAVRTAFERTNAEFNAFDERSTIRRSGRCSAFGRPCWDFAFNLKAQTDGAFDPNWQGRDKLDFGAVAKGFAVDVAAERVMELGSSADVLIDLGGNLRAVKGDWQVGIKDGETFLLHEGEACATSACYYRGDHIKDARTGGNVANTVYSVTVIHPSSAVV
ncbi:MAG: FAD:protein FMN transferase, partial [bacterium]|nr:FAD:protein FMN transferase [Candidatus Colisoma equi]